ncbi:hypothetical protein N7486_011383 [Penicillium sp. IBT 16267x]|nr:hypothetical protein N7486_011383 [Penicillium sp. IBT 16267x]
MASSKIGKRARANTAGDTHLQLIEASANQTSANEAPVLSAKEMISLKAEGLAELLHEAAKLHPDVNHMVITAINSMIEERKKRVIDFDHYSKSIWSEINVRYKSMKGSKQYDISFDVASEVSSTISHIANQCAEFPNPRTRRNGLETLRKIGKTICLSSNDTLGHEVQKQFQADECLENAMHDIVSEMSAEERQIVSHGPLWQKLEELEQLANDYCVFEGLHAVMGLIQGEGGEDEDEEEQTEDEGNDEDDFDEEEYDEKDEYGVTGDEHDIC